MRALLHQAFRFGIVGICNTAVGLLSIYALMFFFHAGAIVANLLGYAVGLTVSFLLNRMWTFNSSARVARVLPRYILTAGICYLLNLGVVAFSTMHFSANPYLAQLFGVGIYTVCMFSGCRWFVFGPRQETDAKLPAKSCI